MKCADCPYFWQDTEKGDRYPHCQWVARCPGDVPLCEEPAYEEPEDYYG